MSLYYQGLRWTQEFRSRARLWGGLLGEGIGLGTRLFPEPAEAKALKRAGPLSSRLSILLPSRFWEFVMLSLWETALGDVGVPPSQWDSAVINRRLIGPFIKRRTCPQVTGLSKLWPTLQVLNWQPYYSSRNGLQKILYEKVIYCQEEFDWAYVFPECGKILPGPSSFVLQRGLLKIKITERLEWVGDGRILKKIYEYCQTTLQVVNWGTSRLSQST